MANTYQRSRILPIILVIVVIIVAVAAIISLARVVFFSGSSGSSPAIEDTSRTALLDTSAGHSVSMTVRGPIVADEEFHSYQIYVSSSQRSITSYVGYLDRVKEQINLGNSVAAYDEFVHALDKANLVKGDQFEGEKNDVRGTCATGKVYEFKVLNNNEPVKTLWTSSCKGSAGSLDASVTQLSLLFTNQIPDADKLVRRTFPI